MKSQQPAQTTFDMHEELGENQGKSRALELLYDSFTATRCNRRGAPMISIKGQIN